jgi:hypothetical protein
MSTGQASDETRWEREQALAFTRHYDSLHWVVTSLLTTSNAALLALGSDRTSVQVGLLGVALSVVTVIFASGFRRLRRRIQERIEPDRWLWGGTGGWTRQWPWYVGFFAVTAALWIWILFSRFPADDWAWGALAGATGVGFAVLYRLGE